MVESLEDDKAQDIAVIALAEKSAFTDYLIIASGTSQRHIGVMAQHIRDSLKEKGASGIAIEGLTHCDWVLIDAGDVVVHLFRPEIREFYDLEKLWGATAAMKRKGRADQAADAAL